VQAPLRKLIGSLEQAPYTHPGAYDEDEDDGITPGRLWHRRHPRSARELGTGRRREPGAFPLPQEGNPGSMLTAIADTLRAIGGVLATIVMLPFRAVARLIGGISDSLHGRH
jgi:hypothetical protein